MRQGVVVVLAVLLGGCYGYYPVTPPGPVGRQVELTLTDSGAVVLARQIGPFAEAVSGRLAADSANSVIVSMSGVRQRDGNETSWKGERVSIPWPLVSRVSERRFSRARTILFGGATAVALVALRSALGGSGFGSMGSGQDGGSGRK